MNVNARTNKVLASATASPQLAQTFPNLEPWYLRRDILCDAILSRFKLGEKVVLLRDQSGFGKTVIAAQCALAHPGHTVCLFITPEDTLLCSPDSIRADFVAQAHRIIHNSPPASNSPSDSGAVRQMLLELHGYAKALKTSVLFVVDGLSGLDAHEYSETRTAVFELLSFSSPAFKFLITLRTDSLTIELPRAIRPFVISSQVFSNLEIQELLGHHICSPAQVLEVEDLTLGIPWKVATLRSICEAGQPLDSVLASAPNSDSEWLKLEWSNVDETNSRELLFLAFRAIDNRHRPIDQIAGITNLDIGEIRKTCERLTFLRVEGKDAIVSFRSEGIRVYTVKRLERFRSQVFDLLITDFLRHPTSPETIAGLPEVLDRAQNWELLLKVLTPAHFGQLMAIAQSLAAIRQRARLGVKAALKSGSDGDVLRYSLQASTLSGMESAAVWGPEIDARLALGDFDGAVRLAN